MIDITDDDSRQDQLSFNQGEHLNNPVIPLIFLNRIASSIHILLQFFYVPST